MFYTLISQIPYINNDGSSLKIFKLFVVGSIFYMLLHYYLFSAKRGVLDNYKQYIYYTIVIDFVIAYLLNLFFGKKHEDKSEKTQITNNTTHATADELKRLEEDYNNMLTVKKKQEILKQHDNEYEIFNKKSEEKVDEKSSKSSKSNKSKNRKEKSSVKKDSEVSSLSKKSKNDKKQKKNKKTSESDELDIPTYKGE